MSSTPAATTTDGPSSRVQSATAKDKQETSIEKTSRPASATQQTVADTSRAPLIAATGREEPDLSTVGSAIRPPSAKQPSTTDTATELRPGSASKNVSQDAMNRPSSGVKVNTTPDSTNTEPRNSRPSSAAQNTDELASHGYSIATNDIRPPSASQNTNGQTTTTGSRPPSASQKTNDSTSAAPTGSRPPSASQKTNDVTPTAPTGSRPPSASQKPSEPTAVTGSRPPSATLKANDATTTSSGSRPPSASQKPSESNANGASSASTHSRPPSANQQTDSTTVPTSGSRPPSANRKQDEIATADSTVDQTTSSLFNANDPNITQPVIGRPPSAAKKPSTDETNIAGTVTDVAPSSEVTNPTIPRIGSATKNLPTSTTTENPS